MIRKILKDQYSWLLKRCFLTPSWRRRPPGSGLPAAGRPVAPVELRSLTGPPPAESCSQETNTSQKPSAPTTQTAISRLIRNTNVTEIWWNNESDQAAEGLSLPQRAGRIVITSLPPQTSLLLFIIDHWLEHYYWEKQYVSSLFPYLHLNGHVTRHSWSKLRPLIWTCWSLNFNENKNQTSDSKLRENRTDGQMTETWRVQSVMRWSFG